MKGKIFILFLAALEEVAKKATKKNPQVIQIDTIWITW